MAANRRQEILDYLNEQEAQNKLLPAKSLLADMGALAKRVDDSDSDAGSDADADNEHKAEQKPVIPIIKVFNEVARMAAESNERYSINRHAPTASYYEKWAAFHDKTPKPALAQQRRPSLS